MLAYARLHGLARPPAADPTIYSQVDYLPVSEDNLSLPFPQANDASYILQEKLKIDVNVAQLLADIKHIPGVDEVARLQPRLKCTLEYPLEKRIYRKENAYAVPESLVQVKAQVEERPVSQVDVNTQIDSLAKQFAWSEEKIEIPVSSIDLFSEALKVPDEATCIVKRAAAPDLRIEEPLIPDYSSRLLAVDSESLVKEQVTDLTHEEELVMVTERLDSSSSYLEDLLESLEQIEAVATIPPRVVFEVEEPLSPRPLKSSIDLDVELLDMSSSTCDLGTLFGLQDVASYQEELDLVDTALRIEEPVVKSPIDGSSMLCLPAAQDDLARSTVSEYKVNAISTGHLDTSLKWNPFGVIPAVELDEHLDGEECLVDYVDEAEEEEDRPETMEEPTSPLLGWRENKSIQPVFLEKSANCPTVSSPYSPAVEGSVQHKPKEVSSTSPQCDLSTFDQNGDVEHPSEEFGELEAMLRQRQRHRPPVAMQSNENDLTAFMRKRGLAPIEYVSPEATPEPKLVIKTSRIDLPDEIEATWIMSTSLMQHTAIARHIRTSNPSVQFVERDLAVMEEVDLVTTHASGILLFKIEHIMDEDPGPAHLRLLNTCRKYPVLDVLLIHSGLTQDHWLAIAGARAWIHINSPNEHVVRITPVTDQSAADYISLHARMATHQFGRIPDIDFELETLPAKFLQHCPFISVAVAHILLSQQSLRQFLESEEPTQTLEMPGSWHEAVYSFFHSDWHSLNPLS